ncbi:Putative uncharacterized protein [Lactococcus lactis subsp. lactis A12]|uniref:Uncharacterized protein n=1 Tax=Lactococcus lactis subsp. lactis A12 TaxID=1137134 RepID=S6EWX8_LACLL|nr:Putative uncharacterized protein [Lactococcus lactis subsp. lactis A12]SBW30955.1 Hypothetical protein LLA12_01806 [Lactococcus lactis subsp. lactis]
MTKGVMLVRAQRLFFNNDMLEIQLLFAKAK